MEKIQELGEVNSPFDENRDLFFMFEALKEAKKAYVSNEVPVGAVLVHSGKIIARAHNETEKRQDPTAHAEVLCLQRAAAVLGEWRLLYSTLYTTLEPCSMCAGALFLSRVERLVWGAPDLRHGADGSFVSLFSEPHPTHKIRVSRHVLTHYSADLMKNFFRERRNNERPPGKPF